LICLTNLESVRSVAGGAGMSHSRAAG
jgi:hypothetical protein